MKLSVIHRLMLAALLALAAACGGNAGNDAQTDADGAPDQAGSHVTLADGPLTEEARRQIALLTDTLAQNDGEVYQTLRRIGRDAVPALVDALYGPYDDKIKQNSMWILGNLGVAADRATPYLEEFTIKGPTWLSFAAKQAIHSIEQSKICGLPGLPEDVEVHVVGRYQGEKELDIQLGESGHTVTEIDVVVDRTANPVALLLTAYDPVVWKVGYTPDSKLVAVLVSGYHSAALLGIPRTLPHRVISGEQSAGCDAFHASDVGDVPGIEDDVMKLTGHGITRFHGASPTASFRVGGDPYFEPSNIEYSSDLSLSDYDVYEGDIPAGTRGIDELERQGRIRAATQQDVDAWLDGAREHNPDMLVRLYPVDAYVVLESITLPPGLFGAHAQMFIIPSGVTRPDGPKGHCQFYYMKDFTRE